MSGIAAKRRDHRRVHHEIRLAGGVTDRDVELASRSPELA
jgi:hypothetical protein